MNYSTWSKWDLHFHTPIDANYKLKGLSNKDWIDLFIKKVIEVEEVKMLAFTDHNKINIELFLELKEELKIRNITTDKFRILPGVEINLDKTIFPDDSVLKKEPQIILIFDDDFLFTDFKTEKEYLENINNIAVDFAQKGKNRNIYNLLTSYNKYHYIISAEGTKSNGFIELAKGAKNNLDKLCDFIISNEFDFFNNQPNEKKYIYTSQLITDILVESVKNRNKYVKSELAFYIVSDNRNIQFYPFSQQSSIKFTWTLFKSLNTFYGLRLLSAFPEKIALEKDTKILSTKKIISKCFVNEDEISFSPELNIIIGKRSSGKTLLATQISKYLNKEIKELKGKNYDNVIDIKKFQLFNKGNNQIHIQDNSIDQNYIMLYPQNSLIADLEKNDDLLLAIKNLLNIDIGAAIENTLVESSINKKIKNLVLQIKNIENLFNQINQYAFQPLFQDFSFNKNANLKEWFINFSVDLSKNIDYFNNNIELFCKMVEENWKVGNLKTLEELKEIDFDIFKIVEKEINILWDSYQIVLNNKNIIDQRLNNARLSLKSINSYIEKQNANFSEENTVFLRFKNNFVNIKTKIENIAKLLFLIESQPINFKELNDEISSSHSISTYEIKKIEFKTINLQDTLSSFIIAEFLKNNTIKMLEKLVSNKFEKNFLKKTAIFSEQKILEKIITKKEIKILKDGKVREENSPGAKATIIFEMIYQKVKNDGQTNIIIFDQPDDSIDNEYIVEKMISIIKDFAKWNQIFIITHNPNLAINTVPDNIIYAYRDSQNNIHYVNSALEGEIKINNSLEPMLSILIKIVEGTKETLRKRIEVYKKNWGVE